MSTRKFFDFSELHLSPGDVVDAALRNVFKYDAYAGNNKFPAVVLTQPVPYNPAQVGAFTGVNKPSTPSGDQALLGETTNAIGTFGFRARIIGPNSPHSFLPDPCVKAITENLPADSAYKLNAMHTLFLSDADYNTAFLDQLPSIGQVVLVELDKNQFGFNLEIGRFVSTITKADEYFNESTLINEACLGVDQMPDFAGTIGGLTGKMASDIMKLKEKSGSTKPGTRIVSQMGANPRALIRKTVSDEYQKWNNPNKKFVENNALNKDSDEYKTILMYWKATVPDWTIQKINNNIYGQPNTKIAHWSSVYISYVFWVAFGKGNVKTNFNASSAHYYYMTHPKWKVYDALETGGGKIKAQVGDVLLTVYNGGARKVVNAHGDVVYAITNGKAML